MSDYKKLDGLDIAVLHGNPGSRRRLREVINSALFRPHVSELRSMTELLQRYQTKNFPHFSIVSADVGVDAIQDLVQAGSSVPVAKRPRVLVILAGSADGFSALVSDLYIRGVDGFLSEPYNANDVCSLLALLVHQEQTSRHDPQRDSKALGILFKEIQGHLDKISDCLAEDRSVNGYVARDARMISKSLAQLFEKSPDQYQTAIIESFETIEAPVHKNGLRKRRTDRTKIKSHPGFIARDLIAKRGFTVDRIAELLRLEKAEFELFLRGEQGIAGTLAHDLSRVLGETPSYWQRLQREWEQYQTSTARSRIFPA